MRESRRGHTPHTVLRKVLRHRKMNVRVVYWQDERAVVATSGERTHTVAAKGREREQKRSPAEAALRRAVPLEPFRRAGGDPAQIRPGKRRAMTHVILGGDEGGRRKQMLANEPQPVGPRRQRAEVHPEHVDFAPAMPGTGEGGLVAAVQSTFGDKRRQAVEKRSRAPPDRVRTTATRRRPFA